MNPAGIHFVKFYILAVFTKSAEKNQFWFISDTNNRHFTSRPTFVHDYLVRLPRLASVATGTNKNRQ